MRPVLLLVALALLAPTPAQAAWLMCEQMVTGDRATAKTEIDAKQKALTDWTAKARLLGVEYTRWQLAWNRRLACAATAAGDVSCLARGRPCRVTQTPPPPDSKLLKPAQPDE